MSTSRPQRKRKTPQEASQSGGLWGSEGCAQWHAVLEQYDGLVQAKGEKKGADDLLALDQRLRTELRGAKELTFDQMCDVIMLKQYRAAVCQAGRPKLTPFFSLSSSKGSLTLYHPPLPLCYSNTSFPQYRGKSRPNKASFGKHEPNKTDTAKFSAVRTSWWKV